METLQEMTVGQLAASDYRKVDVFRKYGIDFCCGGKKSISKVCREKGISIETLESELRLAEISDKLYSRDFDNWNLDSLVDYIVQIHHGYVIQTMPAIFDFTQKVSRVHGQHHPQVVDVAGLFVRVMGELNPHMMKEEEMLFPYIKKLVEAKESGQHISSVFGTIRHPVNMMEYEHETVADLMQNIRTVTTDYLLPDGACNSFRYVYAKLQEFEADLHQHIHLENNILFPKAIQLEMDLQQEAILNHQISHKI